MITVSKADVNDLPEIQQLSQLLFDEYLPYDNFLKKDWSFSSEGKDYFAKALTNADYLVLKAVVDNKMIGYLLGYIRISPTSRPIKTAELDNIVIDVNHRQQGIGSLLVDKFNVWCLEQNIKSIMVTTYSRSAEALDFYHKNGFKDFTLRLEKQI